MSAAHQLPLSPETATEGRGRAARLSARWPASAPRKLQRLGFQRQPQSALSPVRALRMEDDRDDSSKDRLISIRGVWDVATAVALIDSFRREFPRGLVEYEDADGNAFPMRTGKQLLWLFGRVSL